MRLARVPAMLRGVAAGQTPDDGGKLMKRRGGGALHGGAAARWSPGNGVMAEQPRWSSGKQQLGRNLGD